MKAAMTQADSREFSFSEKDFRFLSQFVTQRTGIVLADHKRDMVYGRVARRLRALNLRTFSEYCELIQSDAADAELGNLVNAITTNLTSFFREPHHFDHLRQVVLEPLAACPPPGKRLRIWSAGCSSGMEPYSIAMTLHMGLPRVGDWDARILATDIDTNMLDRGVAGIYPGEQAKTIPQAAKKLYRQQSGDIHMSGELQRLIAFKYLNLLESWPMKGAFDAIFCRNVVIYFDKETQRKLFARIAERLHPGGWLYIGHSENLFKVSDRFELCGRTIYRRID